MDFTVDKAHDGVLLRSYLKGSCGVSSRLLIQLKKRENGIAVNGAHVTVRYRLARGDVVSLSLTDDRPQEVFTPVSLPVRVLYEDEAILAVDKPAGMPTHPSAGHDGDTLANALADLFAKRGEPFVFRPVSRLDKDTSGVLTLAKTRYAAGKLCEQMQSHRIRKTYFALTDGFPPAPQGRIRTGTRRREDFFVLREVCAEDAPGAMLTVTDYRVAEAPGNGVALLELHPLTGRTHQIRVQLAHLGCPVLGDRLYGSPSPYLARQALHASSVELIHPLTGKELRLISPFPRDFAQALRVLREGGSIGKERDPY